MRPDVIKESEHPALIVGQGFAHYSGRSRDVRYRGVDCSPEPHFSIPDAVEARNEIRRQLSDPTGLGCVLILQDRLHVGSSAGILGLVKAKTLPK